MIKSVNSYHLEDIIKKDANFYYTIPKYQREYTWSQSHWKALYDDLEENGKEYFIGSIICINTSVDSISSQSLEVVDGQQRLTTISLFMAAIYSLMKNYEAIVKDDEDSNDDYITLKKSLINKGSPNGLILVPQIQNNNDKDFSYVMAESGLIKAKKERNFGNRKIAKCYKYFYERIYKEIQDLNAEEAVEKIREIFAVIRQAVIVKIEVCSHSEAYMLFESLNNRGASLTAIELMKNTILSRAEQNGLDPMDCYNIWQELLENISDDYATQERFFRHYYNAYKNKINAPLRVEGEKKKDVLGNVATKSNLLNIYETLIKRNLEGFLKDITASSKVYSMFLLRNEDDTRFNSELQSLYRVQGTPSYLLLLYLVEQQKPLDLTDAAISAIIKLLVCFFVRRNLTDFPNTQDVTRMFMNIISDIENDSLTGNEVYELIFKELSSRSVPDEKFVDALNGDIYEDNVGITRFILCSLTEKAMTKENFKDLWAQIERSGKKVYEWTIEHIFPEGENIPDEWVNMIAGGDKDKAKEYREKYVHKLGNLTMTVYNSKLSNMSFERKRDRVNDAGKFIGYKNGLEINEKIARKDKWTVEDIKCRTDELVKEVMDLFSFVHI